MSHRVHRSLLAAVEKTTARAHLAAALPRWVSPDQLTALGALAHSLVLAGYLLCATQPRRFSGSPI